MVRREKARKIIAVSVALFLLASLLIKGDWKAEASWVDFGQWPYGSYGIWTLTQAPDGTIWFGGDSGYIARLRGNTWEIVDDTPTSRLYEMLVSSDGKIWVCGSSGYVFYYEGGYRYDVRTPPVTIYRYLDAMTEFQGTIWVAGEGGYTFRWNGSSWDILGNWGLDPNAYHIYDLAVYGGNLWAIGTSGYFALWNGNSWEIKGKWPFESEVPNVMIAAQDGLWAAGSDGSLAKWNGSSWIACGQWPYGTWDIRAIASAPDGAIWVAGEQGYVATFKNGTWTGLGQWLYGSESILRLAYINGSIWATGVSGHVAQLMMLESPTLSVALQGENAVLSWTAVSEATSYVVERSTDGSNFSVLAEVSETSFVDYNLPYGTYYYRVKAKNVAYSSAYSNVVNVTIQPPQPPQAPYLTATLDGNNAVLSWTDVGATEYILERSLDGTSFSPLATLTSTSYTDGNLSYGTYYYRVKARNNAGDSAYSNVVSVTISPPTPRTWRVYWQIGGSYVVVEWDAGEVTIPGNAQLWRVDTISGTWLPVKDISEAEKSSFTWVDTNVTAGLNYKYQIRYYDPATWSWKVAAESDWAVNERPLAAPAGLRIVSRGDGTATVTWKPVEGASSYQVQVSTDGGATWQTSSVGGPPVTVPRPCLVRVKAGTHARSQWSSVLTVN